MNWNNARTDTPRCSSFVHSACVLTVRACGRFLTRQSSVFRDVRAGPLARSLRPRACQTSPPSRPPRQLPRRRRWSSRPPGRPEMLPYPKSGTREPPGLLKTAPETPPSRLLFKEVTRRTADPVRSCHSCRPRHPRPLLHLLHHHRRRLHRRLHQHLLSRLPAIGI